MNPSQKAGNSYRKKNYRKASYKADPALDAHILSLINKENRKVCSKIESKTADNNNTAFSIDYNGSSSIFSLTNLLTRGTGENQFVGDAISPTRLRLKWAVQAKDSTNLIRVIITQNIAGGGTPTVGTLLEAAGTVNTPLSPYNNDYKGTYKVLFDEFYATCGDASSGYTSTSHISGDITIPIYKLRKIMFLTGSTTVSVGGLYVIFVSDSSVVTPPIGQYYSRLYYRDA